jgi:fido (protein-threonine AMPylation protein)
MATFDPGYGETEVSEEEREALTPFAMRALGDPVFKAALYDVEQTIQDRVGSDLVDQIRSGSLGVSDILTDHFVRELHRQLYGDLWEWGGKFRRVQTNIGIAPEQIAVQLRSEMDNLRFRWEEVHDLEPAGLALLTHVVTVRIHPFVDGNGRATRLLADLVLLAASAGSALRFDWNIDRMAYIAALVHYDNGRDLAPMADLVRVLAA